MYVDFGSKRMLYIVILSFKYFAWNSSRTEIRIGFKLHPYYTGSYVFDLQIEEMHSQISGRSQHLLFLYAVVSYLFSVTVLTAKVDALSLLSSSSGSHPVPQSGDITRKYFFRCLRSVLKFLHEWCCYISASFIFLYSFYELFIYFIVVKKIVFETSRKSQTPLK